MHKLHKKWPEGYNASIDHEKKDVSAGPYHRGLSPGHDLLYFIEGIRQFRDGEFRTVYWKDGVAYSYKSNLVQPDGTNTYDHLPLWKATIAYSIHMFCDFFSSKSLPLPGIYYFKLNPDHVVRQIAEKVYSQDIHLRHVTFQTLPPILISIFISVYFWLRYYGIDDCEDAKTQKKAEMTCLALGVFSAINAGKVCIKSQGEPLSMAFYLNYPQLAVFAKNILHLLILESKRNDYVAKVTRNVNDMIEKNEEIKLLVMNGMTASYEFTDADIRFAS